MKKIVYLISFILISFLAKGQYPVNQSLGSDSTMILVKGGIKGRMVINNFTDTTQANTQRIKDYSGGLIYTLNDSSLWVRNVGSTKWSRIYTSGGSLTTPDLQSVTDINNQTTNNLIVSSGFGSKTFQSGASFEIEQTGTGKRIGIISTSLTDNRTATLQDTSGIIAYLSNISDSSWGLAGNTIIAGKYLGTNNVQDLVLKTNSNAIATFSGDGLYRVKMGNNTTASGNNSTAMGNGTAASGTASTAMGISTTASGSNSTAMGESTKSKSYSGTVIGTFNDSTNATSTTSYNALNRAFEVGIGTANNARSNAITVLFNGKTGIGTTTPDSLLTVEQGLLAKRGVRFSSLPTGVGTKALRIDASGSLSLADTTTNITGNAATATALQTARTIGTTTGDATSAGSTFDGTANNTNALTLATVNSNVGTFTNSTITVNGKGLITSASSGTGLGTVTSVAALTLGTTGTDLSSTVANGTTTPVITLQVPTASATNRGALSSADWTAFNNKGSVSSIATDNTTGITGGTITTTGTLAIDTTVISTRKWRQKGIDSVQANLTTGLALKVNISDTSSMLSSYFRKVDTASLSNRINLKLNISDTSSMLSPYARTNSVNAGLALKVNISDTATMLTSYLRKVDTTAMLSPYKTFYPRTAISLTTTGSSGAATYNNSTGVINVPVYTDAYSGTVTSVATNNGSGITGGTITTSGTLAIDTLLISTRAWRQKGIDSVVALIPSTTGYVPYTGATQDVDLDAFKLNAQSLHIKGTGGNGHLGLKHQSASATASANEVSLFSDNLGNLSWQNGNLYLSKFITSGNTAARSYTFPNATGTIALTSDLTGYLTSVTATSPLSSSGGTTPNITIAQATTSVNGYLSSTDWTTFNAKESVLTFSSPLVRTTNTISIPVATTSVNGYLSSADWTTFNNKQGTITLTTTGTSGAATFSANTLNIPNYGSALSGYLPLAGGTLTGALGGTSASFSALVSIAAFTSSDLSASTQLSLTRAGNQFTGIAIRGSVAADRAIFSIPNDDALYIGRHTGGVGAWEKQIAFLDNGNVGIGTTSPASLLTINATANSNANTITIYNNNTTAGAYASIGSYYANGNTNVNAQIRFGNENNNGGESYLALATGTNSATEHMRITSGGNVLVGTTTDAGYKLDVNGTGRFSGYGTANSIMTEPVLRINGSNGFNIGSDGTNALIGVLNSGTDMIFLKRVAGVYSAALTINSSGNVGIGTTSPQKALDIFTTASSATEYQLSLRNGAGANNISTGIAFGFNSSSLDPDYLSAISSIITNRSTRAADLTFLTAATGTLVESMRITSAGNVGIGTTSPTELLDVRNSYREPTSGEFTQLLSSTTTQDAGRGGSLGFGGFTNGTSGYTTFSGIKGFKENGDGGNTAGALAFYTRVNGGAINERVRITSGGNVGIGTSSPTFKFDIETTNLTVGRFYSSATGKRNNILIQNSTNYNYGVIGVVSSTGSSNGDVFSLGYSASGSTAFTEVLNWTSTGNVLIGTTTDAGYKLDVNGTSRFSGNMNINKTGSSSILFLSNGDISSVNGTDAAFLEPQNGGKTSYFGRENSTGSWVFSTAVTPYSTVIAAYNTTAPIILGHNNAEVTIADGGATTFSSSVTATSFIPSGATVPTNGMYLSAANTLDFATASTNRLTINSSGNLGLGVTPSAWSAGKSISVGSSAAFYGDGINYIWSAGIAENAYKDATVWKYVATGYSALRYEQLGDNGTHAWFTAPSGTAGNAITFTQAMTLFSTGNLAIATTTDAGYKLDVNGTGRFGASVTATQFIAQESNSASSTQIQIVNTSSANNTTKTAQLLFRLADIASTVKSAAYIRAIPEGVNVQNAALSFATRSGDSDPVERLSIASTGAATFSSSVTASQGNFNQIGNAFAINMTNRNNNQTWGLVVDTDAVDDKILGLQSSYGITPFFALKLEASGGAATFSSSIKTAAPSGGTAKPFKIGAAATVTPTSQNRTIEIEIDGVTYYLTAKTTND